MPTKAQKKNASRTRRRAAAKANARNDEAQEWKHRMSSTSPTVKNVIDVWTPVLDAYGDMCIRGVAIESKKPIFTSPVVFMSNTICQTLSGSIYRLASPSLAYLAFRDQQGLGKISDKVWQLDSV